MVVFRTVMLIQMWGRDRFEVAVTVRQARDDRFPQCNAGADVAWGNAGKGGVSLCMVMLCFRCGTCKYYDCSCDIQLVRCGAGRGPEDQRPEDQRTREPGDQSIRGPEDQGTRGPEDQRTRGPGDQSTRGPEDQGTRGSEDQRTRGPEDQRPRGPKDERTRGPGDQRTRGPEDQRTLLFFLSVLGFNFVLIRESFFLIREYFFFDPKIFFF